MLFIYLFKKKIVIGEAPSLCSIALHLHEFIKEFLIISYHLLLRALAGIFQLIMGPPPLQYTICYPGRRESERRGWVGGGAGSEDEWKEWEATLTRSTGTCNIDIQKKKLWLLDV